MKSKGKAQGNRSTARTWIFDTVKRGTGWNGYLAGPVHGVVVHCKASSKPCLKILCGENAECEGCREHVRAQWFGYVPVWRDDGKPCVVGIKPYHLEEVEKIEHRAAVRVGRGSEYHDGVIIRPIAGAKKLVTDRAEKLAEVDLTEWLCVLWRMPMLVGALRAWWDRDEPAAADPVDTIPAVEVPVIQPGLAAQVADKMTQAELGYSLAEVFKRRGMPAPEEPPERNGVAKRVRKK